MLANGIQKIYQRTILVCLEIKKSLPQMVTPMSLANLALDIIGDKNILSNVLGKAVKMIQD